MYRAVSVVEEDEVSARAGVGIAFGGRRDPWTTAAGPRPQTEKFLLFVF